MSRRLILLAGLILLAVVLFRGIAPSDSPLNGQQIVTVAVPVSLGPEETAGQEVFDAQCAVCHGPNASGIHGAGPPLVHKIYEPGHHSDDAFRLAAIRGVRAHHWSFGDMPLQPDVGADEMEAVIAYVRALQRANGIN